MKFFAPLSILLAAALAGASNSCPDANEVTVAINAYVNDVTQVNNVIDNNSPSEDPATFQTAVGVGLFFETNEPVQLSGTLALICDPEDGANGAIYLDNVEAVLSATEQVLGVITDIQQDVITATDGLSSINEVRCCTILPGLDKIFSIAALTLGVTGDVTRVTAPRPSACNNVPEC